MTDPIVFDHRSNCRLGLLGIDIEIGRWAHESRLPIYFPTPSLVQHIGDSSSIWVAPDARAMGNRRADRFSGEIRQDPSDTRPA